MEKELRSFSEEMLQVFGVSNCMANLNYEQSYKGYGQHFEPVNVRQLIQQLDPLHDLGKMKYKFSATVALQAWLFFQRSREGRDEYTARNVCKYPIPK